MRFLSKTLCKTEELTKTKRRRKGSKTKYSDYGLISSLVAKVAKEISKMPPGTVLEHTVLADMLQVDYNKEVFKYHGRISSLRNLLRNQYQVFLKPLYKIGYEITPPGNEIDICMNKISRGVKQVVDGACDAKFIAVENIKSPQKRAETLEGVQKIGFIVGILNMVDSFPDLDPKK